MRIRSLLLEALFSARARKVSSIMTAVLVATMCITTLLTVGRTAAGEQQVAARLDDAGSRHLRIIDVKDLGFLTPSVVALVGNFDSVETAIGTSVPVDVTNRAIGSGGNRAPAWKVHGDVEDAVDIVSGRAPAPGEALIAHDMLPALGFDFPVGAVASGGSAAANPIVGTFTARQPYTAFDDGVVIAAEPGESADALDVVIRTSADAATTESAVLALLRRTDPTDLSIESPRTLAEVQTAVLGDLGRTNRSVLLLVLGAGALLVAVISLADVLLQRTDLGRRRALGAPRWVLVALVVSRTGIAAALGAALGTGIGLLAALRAQQVPDLSFVIATAVLAILTACAAAIPPAVFAASQDPVRVLRTP